MRVLKILLILLFLGCETLLEQTSPLEGKFYIEDGWIAFETKNYDSADKHFSTAINQNENDSLILFQSNIGLGWTNLYKGREISETNPQGFVHSSGMNFGAAEELMNAIEMDVDPKMVPEFTLNKIDMYAGISFQKAHLARQLSLNGNNWESTNSGLGDSIISLIQESTIYCQNLPEDFIFQHDSTLVYHDIVLLRVENYILLGEISNAVIEYNQMDKNYCPNNRS